MGQQVRHLLKKRESTGDNHASARQRVEWPRADLFGYIIKRVELREQPSDGKLLSRSVQRALFFRREFFVPFRVNSPAANSKLFWPYLFHLSSPEENPPPLRTPYLF